MCFTPQVSLITAIIEFSVAIYLFKKAKEKNLLPIVFFVLVLGIYQFTEFMLCSASNANLWARAGFATYTILPVLGAHLLIKLSKKRFNKLFYLIPITFSALALTYPGFITYSSCNLLHVTVKSIIFNENKILMFIYLIYYSAFPLYGLYVFSKNYRKTENKSLTISLTILPLALLLSQVYFIFSAIYEFNIDKNWITTSTLIVLASLIIIALGTNFIKNKQLSIKILFYVILSAILTTLILYGILPIIGLELSSIFCQFAIFYTITAVIFVETSR